MESVDERLTMLERRLRRTQLALTLIALAGVAVAGFAPATHAAPTDQSRVLHLRGLVIEDDQGRPRVLVGAPSPHVVGRKRGEGVNGIILLGPNGADRVVISYPSLEPQVMGKVETRSIAVPSAGLLINDSEGNERAGLGASDDGSRVSLGLDYSDRDAMGLLVSPNFSGLAVFARNGERNDQITEGVLADGTSTFKLADSSGDEHFMFEGHKGSSPRFLLQNPTTHKLQDVTAKLVP